MNLERLGTLGAIRQTLLISQGGIQASPIGWKIIKEQEDKKTRAFPTLNLNGNVKEPSVERIEGTPMPGLGKVG